MPEFDKVQHYFGKVGIFGVTEENGYFIKGFTVEQETVEQETVEQETAEQEGAAETDL
jgi:hypothetical protein